jgi:hypothetical protein
MPELLAFISTQLGWLFSDNWFTLSDSNVRSGLASVTLRSSGTILEFVKERNEMSVRLRPAPMDGSRWFWIGVARRVLAGERPGSDTLDHAAVEFLKDHLNEIDDAFQDSAQAEKLVARLAQGQQERSEEHFGPTPQ